ncbi:MAG: hypothetical protein ACOC5T_07065 [Elusimicrobiota bacterium]
MNLEEAIREYNNVCEKLESLNDRAFQLEQHIMWLEGHKKKRGC